MRDVQGVAGAHDREGCTRLGERPAHGAEAAAAVAGMFDVQSLRLRGFPNDLSASFTDSEVGNRTATSGSSRIRAPSPANFR